MREAKSNAGYTAFFFALRSGDVRRVQNYLASNKRLAVQSKDGFPALNFVLRECFQSVEIIHDIVAQLLDHGADVNSKDTNGNTPLLETLTSPVLRTSKNLLALVQLLLDRGANVNVRYRSGNCVLQAVFARKDTEGLVELVRLLLERGADASFQFPDGRNFLHHTLLARGSSLTREDTFALIKLLLKHEAEVNQKDKDGNTPLHLATLYCDPQIVTLLLPYQAHVNVKNYSHGNTPLHNALLCSEDDFIAGGGFLNMAHILLDAGADLFVANNRGCTPLHDALTQQNKFLWEDILKLVRFLLKRSSGKELNIKDTDGNTCLHLAAKICNVAMVKLLLHHEADVNARNYLGDTPLHFALLCTEGDCAFGNFYKVVQTLLDAGADLGVTNNRGCTPLQDALTLTKTFLWEDILKLIKLLLEQHHIDLNFIKDRDDNTPLHLAARTCNVEMVKLLLNYQTDIDTRNKAGDTPLIEAIRCYDTDAAAGVGMVEFIQMLVDRGADVTIANSLGCTPLHCAFLVPPDRRQPEDLKRLVKLLVALQARVNAQDAHGSSPLHLAAQTRQYDTEIAQLLLDNMANVDPKTALGDTPLLLAIQCYNDSDDNGFIDFVCLLLDRRANASTTNLRDCSPLQYVFQMRKEIKKQVFSCLIRLLVEHQADVNVKIGVIGNSLLHLAVKSSTCDLEIILLLLEYGADVNARNELGETPLHRALKSHSRHVSDDDLFNRCELLLIAGAKACSKNHEGRTPLHEAVDNDKVTSVLLLLDYSADVEVKDRSGDTPLLIAVRRANVESVTLLLEHGGDQNAVNNSDETPLLLACAKKSLDLIYQLIRLSPHHLRPQLRRPSEVSFGY